MWTSYFRSSILGGGGNLLAVTIFQYTYQGIQHLVHVLESKWSLVSVMGLQMLAGGHKGEDSRQNSF